MPSLRATRPLLLLTLSLVTLRVEATCYWQNSPTLAIDDPDAIAQDDTACVSPSLTVLSSRVVDDPVSVVGLYVDTAGNGTMQSLATKT